MKRIANINFEIIEMEIKEVSSCAGNYRTQE